MPTAIPAIIDALSRSTWACELKSNRFSHVLQGLTSRSTWACELKWNLVSSAFHKKSSRSTWACELKCDDHWLYHRNVESRSTWACELKLYFFTNSSNVIGHAPRERVSWNSSIPTVIKYSLVTLHVSVWVEMPFITSYKTGIYVTLHVSVWVEMNKVRI